MRYKLKNGNVILADADFITTHHPDATLEAVQMVTEIKAPISVLDFRNRFTQDEKVAIYTAARGNKVSIQIWIDDLAVSGSVRLDSPATVAGVNAMASAGLIGLDRVAKILE